MKVFGPLADFFLAVREDGRMGPTHVSLYLALLNSCNVSGGQNPVVITREEVMKAAKIKARQTYNQCIRELHCYGYIKYRPSFHPTGGCMVFLNPLQG
jgi:hypothetical protein